MGRFEIGDKVRVVKVLGVDKGVFEVGDVFTILSEPEFVYDGILYDIDCDYMMGWSVYEDQVELVESYDKDLELGEMQAPEEKKNIIELAIEELEEQHIIALSKKIDQIERVEQAEKILRDKDLVQRDIDDEIQAITRAIDALREV